MASEGGSENPPDSPPTSADFNTDRPPPSRTSENYTDDEDEAAVDPTVIRDEPEDEEDGEDHFNENYMEDYRRMEEHDLYDSVGLDDSMDEERDLDQIMLDRKAAEMELDARDTTHFASRHRPHLLGELETDEDSCRPSKRSRAMPTSNDDSAKSSQARSEEDEDEDDGEFEMYKVQGTLREWVTRDEVRRFIAAKFKEFLLSYSKTEDDDIEYVPRIIEMASANKCSLEIDYRHFIFSHPNIAIWLADAPQSVLEVMKEVARKVVFDLHPNYKNIHQTIYVRFANFNNYTNLIEG